MKTSHFIVLTKSIEGREAEFEQWYDEQHLRDLVAVPGVIKATRFRIVHQEDSTHETPAWASVALYEIEADDPMLILAEINARSGTERMPMTSAIDLGAVLQLLGKQTKTCSRADTHGVRVDAQD